MTSLTLTCAPSPSTVRLCNLEGEGCWTATASHARSAAACSGVFFAFIRAIAYTPNSLFNLPIRSTQSQNRSDSPVSGADAVYTGPVGADPDVRGLILASVRAEPGTA